jgi:transposase
MSGSAEVYVGLDVHKDSTAVAIAEAGRDGEVRFWGNIESNPASLDRLITRLRRRHSRIFTCYEAGPCGYWIYRWCVQRGIACEVVAPSLIRRTTNETRIKNDHRDAMTLARLHRAGELTPVWVPDEVHEAMRDLVRVRESASEERRRARQRIRSFLLKYRCGYTGKNWTKRHRIWLADRTFQIPAQQIAFQNHLNALEQAEARIAEVEAQILQLLPEWALTPQVEALQALRGVALVVAVNFVCEVGDIHRFKHPRQLMAFLGLVPGEHSSGSTRRARGITRVGNSHLRSILFEAAWNYSRFPKVGQYQLTHRNESLPQTARDLAWKAQVRLTARYRYLMARGKRSSVAITAVARELVGFMWAIATEVAPAPFVPGAPAQVKKT